MERVIKKWWNDASSYYQDVFRIPVDNIYYGPYCPTEKELNIIGVDKIKNKKILELGCGGGQCSIFLSKNGANCSGIDISKKQLQYARDLAIKNNVDINYFLGSGEDLKMFKNEQFDVVLSIFSLQYIRSLDKCFNEVKRVLKRKGRFIFSLDHPFYSVIFSETMKIYSNYNYSTVNRLIKTSDIIKRKYWCDGNKSQFFSYFRKVSDIHETLVDTGFDVEKIIEPFSCDIKGPWDKIYSKRISKYLPPTIIFVAVKK